MDIFFSVLAAVFSAPLPFFLSLVFLPIFVKVGTCARFEVILTKMLRLCVVVFLVAKLLLATVLVLEMSNVKYN